MPKPLDLYLNEKDGLDSCRASHVSLVLIKSGRYGIGQRLWGLLCYDT